MKKKIKFITIFLFLLSGCGFQNINSIYENNLIIKNINITGQQSIIYLFKNELYDLKSDQNTSNGLELDLKVDFKKDIYEKNNKNVTTKYSLNMTVDLTLKNDLDKTSKRKNFNKADNFNVGSNTTITINNEKKLLENLTKSLVRDIKNFLQQQSKQLDN